MAVGSELVFAIKIAGMLDGSLSKAVSGAQQQLRQLSSRVNRMGNYLTAGIANAGAKVLRDSIETYKNYETAVNSAAAVYNVTNGTEQYEQLAEAARQVGRETVKSAQEGANALEYMGLAGWSVEDSVQALIPVVKLSASTGMDLATTSDLVTDTMAAMGIGIEGVGHYLDVLAKGNNSANYTSQMLLESLANVGGVFRSLNVGVEDGAAVLGVLANQGTKGAEAGTQLNTVLTRMQKLSGESYKGMQQLGISMFDAAGNTRNIIDVFQDMYNATKNMTDEQRNQAFTLIGGTRGYRALTKIMSGFTDTAEDGTPIIRSLAAAYRDADGSLENFYDIKTATMEGALQRLKRLYEDMGITIGEALAPNLNNLVKNLSEKMPQISDVVTGVVEDMAPPVMNFLDYIVDNSDTVIEKAVGFAKGWTKMKIGSAAVKEASNIVMLVKNLASMDSVKSIMRALVTGLAGVSAKAVPVLGTVTGIATAGYAIYNAYKALKPENLMGTKNDWIQESTDNLVKYTALQKEVRSLQRVVTNPATSSEDLEAAKTRLQEIAEMVGLDYTLTINADTTALDNALQSLKTTEAFDVIDEGESFLDTAKSGVKDYTEAVSGYQENMEKAGNLQNEWAAYSAASAEAAGLVSRWQNNQMSEEAFMRSMKEIQAKYGAGTETSITSANTAADYAKDVIETEPKKYKDLENTRKAAQGQQETINKFEEDTRKAGENFSRALASYAEEGDFSGIQSASRLMEELGSTMKDAGMSTDDLAASFAAAKQGSIDFETALGTNGENALAMAQDYIAFKDSIGEAGEETVLEAALIANGFRDIASASAAGDGAIQNVISSLYSLGSEQGIFEGMDTGAAADKLSDMAHAMDLLPESKTINIDTNGNIGVIQEAQDLLDSVRSQGNVDVTLSANGDVSILDELTGKVTNLQKAGAVDLSVNASGDIEVLDEAQNILATIDSETGKEIGVTVDANVTPGEVNAEGLTAGINSATQAAAGDGGSVTTPVDANLTPGMINAAGLTAGINSATQAAAANGGSVNTAVDATLTPGAINGGPLREGVMSHAKSILGGFGVDTQINATANLNVNDNITGTARNASAAVQSIPTSHNTTLSANGNALGVAQSVASAIANIHSKTVTITVNYRKTGTDALNAPFKTAKGIRNAPEGLYMVNDQNINDPREVIEYHGRRIWYEGRNIVTMLPQGANVYPAARSKEYIDGSHRSGLKRVPFDGYIAELHKDERVLTSSEASVYNNTSINRGIFEDISNIQNIERETPIPAAANSETVYNIDAMPRYTDTASAPGGFSMEGYFGALRESARGIEGRSTAGAETDPVGRRLRDLGGVSPGSGSSVSSTQGAGAMAVTFSPTYIIEGNAGEKELKETAKMSQRDFEKYMKEWEKNNRRRSFAT